MLLSAKHCGPARIKAQPQQRTAVVCHAITKVPSAGATAAAAFAASLLVAQSASAVGIESVDILPSSFEKPEYLARFGKDQQEKLDAVDEAFQNSSTLKELLARSEANKAKNKKDIQNKYCFRQAELGIGDCGGLRYIPGLTESGKQKTPQWLADLLGVEVPEQDPTGGKSLKDLIYADGAK